MKALPKLMVIGHARHGKDTFCEMLRDDHGYSFQSSSRAALDIAIWPVLGGDYPDKEACFADRAHRRADWYTLISEYGRGDPARLAREIFSRVDIYCGIREWEQLCAARLEGLFDYVVWVDRSEHVEQEGADSMNLLPSQADIVVDNNGSLESLRQSACDLARLVEGR